jgi:hypothetical protein
MSTIEDKKPKEDFPAIASVLRDLGRQFLSHVKVLQQALHEAAEAAQPFFANLQANIKALPGRITDVQRTLARRGWFLLPNAPAMKLINLVEEYSSAGRMIELDELMMRYIDSQLDEIEADLVSRYPARAALFEEAIKAHRQEMYASSITVLLSQADGICVDLLGQKLFSMETGKGGIPQPKTKRVIESYGVSVFQEMMLEPLLSGSGMGAGEKAKGFYPDSPNRHIVMHGIDTTYPSHMNSTKVISLVAYFGGIVHEIIEEVKVASASNSSTPVRPT